MVLARIAAVFRCFYNTNPRIQVQMYDYFRNSNKKTKQNVFLFSMMSARTHGVLCVTDTTLKRVRQRTDKHNLAHHIYTGKAKRVEECSSHVNKR